MSVDELFKEKVLVILKNLKNEKKEAASSPVIPIYKSDRLIAYLRVASKSSLTNKEEIKNLTAWRKQHIWWFTAQFNVTSEGTKKWFEKQVLATEDRLLFMVETPSGIPFGHMGLFRFDFTEKSCEIDNVVRGQDHLPGAMTASLMALIDWTFNILEVNVLYLRVFSDNKKAIELYSRCGFQEVKKIPLKKVEESDRVLWVEQEDSSIDAQRYFTQMKLDKHV